MLIAFSVLRQTCCEVAYLTRMIAALIYISGMGPKKSAFDWFHFGSRICQHLHTTHLAAMAHSKQSEMPLRSTIALIIECVCTSMTLSALQDELLPIIPTPDQMGESWGGAVDFGQRAAAALALTIVVAKFNLVLLATGSATFVFWGPVLGAANRNRILRSSGRYVSQRPISSVSFFFPFPPDVFPCTEKSFKFRQDADTSCMHRL